MTEAVSLARYGVVGTPEDPDLKRIVRLATQVCGVRHAAVNLLDDAVQVQAATEGFVRGVAPRDESLCQVSVTLDQPVHLRDARDDARFAGSPFVDGRRSSIRFYAASQLRRPGGATIGTLCVFDDVPNELDEDQRAALDDLAAQTVQVLEARAEALRLQEVNLALRRSNEDLASFAGRIAHDLRNPITGASGFLALAQGRFGEDLKGRARDCVAHADAALQRMAELVDGLLAFARTGAPPASIDVALASVMSGVAQDCRSLLERTGGSLTWDEDLPVVRSDPALLGQLVQNFVTNGLKYAREGVPPTVRVSGGADGEAGGWWLAVADRGRGIPAEARAAVFEPFVRLPEGRDVSGSGIGLATAARIAEALDCRIEITDTPGGGATFTLRHCGSVPAG